MPKGAINISKNIPKGAINVLKNTPKSAIKRFSKKTNDGN